MSSEEAFASGDTMRRNGGCILGNQKLGEETPYKSTDKGSTNHGNYWKDEARQCLVFSRVCADDEGNFPCPDVTQLVTAP